MTDTIRFIHAADVHLGAPVRGLRQASAEWAERLQRAIPEAYERVIDTALQRKVDFVVLAGDTFDKLRPSYGDFLRFFDGIERLDAAGIPTYLVAGNHDPYTLWAHDFDRLPASVRLLGVNGPEFVLYRRDGKPACIIGGRSYYTQTWPAEQDISGGIARANALETLAESDPDADEAPFMVGVIHTGLDIDPKKAPVGEQVLQNRGVDYWACGHLHRKHVRPSERDPYIAFPGCIQSRDMKETGERGCFLVELARSESLGATAAAHQRTRAKVKLEFIPTSSVVLQQLDIDVSACQTLADVMRLVQASLLHENGTVHCDDMVTHITLSGKTKLHGFLTKREVLNDLRNHVNNAHPSFYCDALTDCTRPEGDGPATRSDSLFPSIVDALAAEQRAREDVLINFVQSELVKRGIAVPGSLDRKIGSFNDEAELLVHDLLREEQE